MPTCPYCRHRFRTLDDETDMHPCPRCGYDPHEKPSACVWCEQRLDDDTYYPYCSSQCAVEAETT